ncbi:MAG: S-layer homology domain-containing protein [Clostridia bacterium]|nr:S-layer homology domain-containing protein [Clostridia bacterium]
MSANENGDFRENDVITRGEFAKVIYKIVEQDIDKTFTKKFLDTDGKYYEEYANALFSNGLIDGFTDGEFKGDLQITRSEACKMINAATGRSDIADELILDDSEKKDFLEFIDVEDFRWFYKDVMLASNDFEIPNKFYETEQTSKNTKKK